MNKLYIVFLISLMILLNTNHSLAYTVTCTPDSYEKKWVYDCKSHYKMTVGGYNWVTSLALEFSCIDEVSGKRLLVMYFTTDYHSSTFIPKKSKNLSCIPEELEEFYRESVDKLEKEKALEHQLAVTNSISSTLVFDFELPLKKKLEEISDVKKLLLYSSRSEEISKTEEGKCELCLIKNNQLKVLTEDLEECKKRLTIIEKSLSKSSNL